MKTISAGTIKTSFPLPVEAETIRRRRHFYIHIPGIPAARKVLAKEYNRFQWMAVIMLVQSILVASIVSVTILSTGNWKPLWFAAAACIYAAFLPCLSGQDLKWIKLVFFISCLLSGLIIVAAVLRSFIV